MTSRIDRFASPAAAGGGAGTDAEKKVDSWVSAGPVASGPGE